ncbi:Uncharacterized membrane protein YjgN, DUF898 family [Tenacibaculum sp. MAR_2009_124]|uniref:YjgN family protein n=1 Tax=Tenacibaculum sp. MAR_2009_124 TaxID=1250059 RepID=UPI000898CCF7|nr:DUF898 family protein [Tenacibaculum sp. MAR_2009_124]SEB78152.1 Uncharacterized membrane protein YjgN, DUF898 family [Tenacibaculum sp. MAR_2009_124]
MQKLTQNKSADKQLRYQGNGSEFALIFFKNVLLTILTLGIYYPWAKIELLKFHSNSTILKDNNFNFHGNPKDVFKSFLVVFLFIIVAYSLLFTSVASNSSITQTILLIGSYLTLMVLAPLIIHGTLKYRSQKTTWKGVQFNYLGSKSELFWKFISGLLITFLTLGIYTPWFVIEIRRYVIRHLRFGNLSFEFQGDGAKLFWIQLKLILLSPLTLGIYTFWYIKELLDFYVNNIEVNQDETKTNLTLNIKVGDVFSLYIVNFALIIFSFGIATPWVITRTYAALASFIEIDDNLKINEIQQTSYKTDSKEGFLDFKLV